MVDWKNIGVPIIVGIIAGTVALISALINFIISALFVPNIHISREPTTDQKDKVVIDITNIGTAAAKSLKLTVQAPPSTSFKYPLFSTEKYSANKTGDPTRLEIDVPRFVQGGGSLIRIESLIDTKTNVSSGDYIVYVTYDQGSVEQEIPVFEKPTKPLSFIDIFFNQYQTGLSFLAAGISLVGGAVGYYVSRTKQKVKHQNDEARRKAMGNFRDRDESDTSSI